MGLAAVVTAGVLRRERRFPRHTPLRTIRTWQDTTRGLLRESQPTVTRGTFAASVTRYLALVRGRVASIKDRTRDLQAWVARFGQRRRDSLTTTEIDAVLHDWRMTRAASTVNHRRYALSNLYRVLDGPGSRNPVVGAVRFREPMPEPLAVPRARITAVLEAMKETKTRARLQVLHWTGLRPSQVMRMTADDVDLARRVCYAPSGKAGRALAIPLTVEAVDAWRLFVRLDAWGPWSTSRAAEAIVRAARRLGVPPFRVYQIRHSFATELRRRGADLADVQALLGHRDPRTTLRYAPVVADKLAAAVDRLSAAKTSATETTSGAGRSSRSRSESVGVEGVSEESDTGILAGTRRREKQSETA